MKKLVLFAVLSLACNLAISKEKMIPLSEADAAALAGKTVALTVHERPSFAAMTAGKVTFGLLGSAAMVSAGNKLIEEHDVQDPAEIVRSQLSQALHDTYAAQLMPVDTTTTKAKKPKDLAALHPDADYVMDVRSGGWMYSYYPTRWGTYWVSYSVQVQLIDTKTARQVSNVACNASTHENPKAPSREQLHADGAKLLKDVTASLGWTCVQILAKEQFRFPAEHVAATPIALVDPLAGIEQIATDPQQSTAAPENVAPQSPSDTGTAPITPEADAKNPDAEQHPAIAPATTETEGAQEGGSRD